jgi:hypothetical protein
MVIGTCPEDDPSDREEKCSFIHSEEADFSLAAEFQMVRKKSA